MFKSVCAVCLMVSVAGMAVANPTTADLKRIEQQLKQERKTGLEARKKASELSQEMKAVQRQIIGRKTGCFSAKRKRIIRQNHPHRYPDGSSCHRITNIGLTPQRKFIFKSDVPD